MFVFRGEDKNYDENYFEEEVDVALMKINQNIKIIKLYSINHFEYFYINL